MPDLRSRARHRNGTTAARPRRPKRLAAPDPRHRGARRTPASSSPSSALALDAAAHRDARDLMAILLEATGRSSFADDPRSSRSRAPAPHPALGLERELPGVHLLVPRAPRRRRRRSARPQVRADSAVTPRHPPTHLLPRPAWRHSRPPVPPPRRKPPDVTHPDFGPPGSVWALPPSALAEHVAERHWQCRVHRHRPGGRQRPDLAHGSRQSNDPAAAKRHDARPASTTSSTASASTWSPTCSTRQTLLQNVEGQICSAVKSTWTSFLSGSTQCGITLTGINFGFGGLGGGLPARNSPSAAAGRRSARSASARPPRQRPLHQRHGIAPPGYTLPPTPKARSEEIAMRGLNSRDRPRSASSSARCCSTPSPRLADWPVIDVASIAKETGISTCSTRSTASRTT